VPASKTRIRAGVGGWTYEPWRSNFYPAGLPHARELEYASTHLTAIEVNGTFYGAQKPATFAKWRDETPDDFVFALKAIQYATHRRVLAEGADSVRRFIGSGITELGPKLGPLVWQFATTKQFQADDFENFLALLPDQAEGIALRHVMDVRHESFMVPEYLALARRYKVATVFCDSDDYPSFCDLTADFVYARLMRSRSEIATGYPMKDIQRWARSAKVWAEGGEPEGLPCIEADTPAPVRPRDVFMFFISGAKERAPAAAMALLKALG
jgi:uncharacterized protein YecE (DUF72 family)